jgi:hypothetical protein
MDLEAGEDSIECDAREGVGVPNRYKHLYPADKLFEFIIIS